MNKNTNLLLATSLTLILSACVTINIYFPAAAAEKAADKIIDEVWQLKDGETKPGETQPGETQPAQPSIEAAPEAKPSETPAK